MTLLEKLLHTGISFSSKSLV